MNKQLPVKICHLTSVHKAYDVRILLKECRTLAASGYDVVLLVPHERDEVVDSVCIRKLPLPRNRWDRMFRVVWLMYRVALSEKADIYHFHDPELIPVGLLLKLQGRRVIYDVHEDLPRHILIKPWINARLRKLLMKAAEAGEWLTARIIDGVAAATPVIARRFPARKTALIQNFPIIDELRNSDLLPYSARSMDVTYVGGLAKERGTQEIIRAMSLLPETLKARLVLAGTCDEQNLQHELYRLRNFGKIVFIGWQTREEISRLLGNVRVGLVILHPRINYVESQPVKLFEYMAAGIPVVASDFPLWRKIIDEAQCGLLVDPFNVGGIADAIRWLLENPCEAELMGKRGQEAVNQQFNWQREADSLLQLYENLFS